MRRNALAFVCLCQAAYWTYLLWSPLRDSDDATGNHTVAWLLVAVFFIAAGMSWYGLRWGRWVAIGAASFGPLFMIVAISVLGGDVLTCAVSNLRCAVEFWAQFVLFGLTLWAFARPAQRAHAG